MVGKHRDVNHPCWIGSVKTNIGHLEPAAGVASLIKVCLALQNKKIPPHLNFSTPNPHIAFDKYHFRVPKKIEEWPSDGTVRKAGISGFGFGGMNAHIVMRELHADEIQLPDSTNEMITTELFILSAKDPVSLNLLIDKWCEYLINNKTVALEKLSYNLHLRRSHYFYRVAIIASSTENLYQSLCEIKKIELTKFKNTNHIFITLKNEPITLAAELEATKLTNALTAYINRQPFDWKAYEQGRNYLYLDLPHHPWQHQHYWPLLKGKSKNQDLVDKNIYPFNRKQIASPLSEIQFEFEFNTHTMPEIKDTFNFLHAGYYLEMLAIVADKLYQQNYFTVENLAFTSPIYIPNEAQVKVQLILQKTADDDFNFTFFTYSQSSNWTQHATGKLLSQITPGRHIDPVNLIKERCLSPGTANEFFGKVINMGMPAGESIRWTKKFWIHQNEVLCEFKQTDSLQDKKDFKLNIHLGIIDGCIQSLFMLLPEKFMTPYIASKIDRISYYGIKNYSLHLVTSLKNIYSEGETFDGDFSLIDANGDVVVEFSGLCMTKLSEMVRIDDVTHPVKFDLNSRQEIIDYLVDQIATIFSMPKQDINTQQSLRDLGIDSLMAIVFSAAIESVFQVSYPMQNLLNGPSILDVAEFIFNHRQQPVLSSVSKLETNNKWIAYREKQIKPQIRLFCFPYGGSGASVYREWQKLLPDTIEVCPIQLPGRENRFDEAPVDNLKLLIEVLLKNLSSEFDLPFAFFGHSFGSLIAFELARALRRINWHNPFIYLHRRFLIQVCRLKV